MDKSTKGSSATSPDCGSGMNAETALFNLMQEDDNAVEEVVKPSLSFAPASNKPVPAQEESKTLAVK